MIFTFLGTGCPVASPLRAGPGHLVSTLEASLLIDCGSGVAQRLVAAGRRGADLDALIVTHYHSDHVVDFYQLLISSWHQGRARPLIVHAPSSAIAHMRRVLDAYRDERELRIAYEKRKQAEKAARALTCPGCGSTDAKRTPGKGPHAAGARCNACGRFWWLSHKIVEAIPASTPEEEARA